MDKYEGLVKDVRPQALKKFHRPAYQGTTSQSSQSPEVEVNGTELKSRLAVACEAVDNALEKGLSCMLDSRAQLILVGVCSEVKDELKRILEE